MGSDGLTCEGRGQEVKVRDRSNVEWIEGKSKRRGGAKEDRVEERRC